MTDDKKQDAIYDILNDMEESELVAINNTYNSYTGLGCHIYEMEEFDDEYDNNTPLEIAEAVTGGSFSTSDTYWAKDEWDDCNSFNCIGDYVDCSDIAQYCVEHDEDFGNEEIREILDKDDDFVIIISDPAGGTECEVTLEEFKEKGEENSLFEFNGEILWGDALIDRFGLEDCDGNKFEIKRVFCDWELGARGFEETLTVCKREGVLFGDNTCFDDGRFYQWWYSDDSDILLRVYFSNITERTPLYFSEVTHTKESVIKLIRSFDAE